MKRGKKLLPLMASLLLVATMAISCSDEGSKEEGQPEKDKVGRTLDKIFNAPKKLSEGVHKLDTAAEKFSKAVSKLSKEVEAYAPDSTAKGKQQK